MKIPPDYTISNEILNLLSKIEGVRITLQDYEIPKELLQNIKRSSLLKSSLYSARIEGNALTEHDLPFAPQDEKKQEIFNILAACEYIEGTIREGVPITNSIILEIHTRVLRELSGDAGKFRSEASAIFNEAGVAIYVTPPPQSARSYLVELLTYINSNEEGFPLVNACISHIIFEKIHPFLDGNGRVGRLLMAAILRAKGYDLKITIPFEQYLDENRSDYYYFLGKGLEKPDEYLMFMLDAYYKQSIQMKEAILKDIQNGPRTILPLRQQEIFNIIQDHKNVSFNFLQRRFLQIPARTLRYDVKKLVEKGMIMKVGKTRGASYSPSSAIPH